MSNDQNIPIDQLMPINYVRLLARELRLKETDLKALLEDTNLSEKDLKGGKGILTITENFTVLRNALKISGDPALGFRLGKLLHISTHGQMGVAAFTSANLEHAIAALCNYVRTRAPFIYIDREVVDDKLVMAIRCTLEMAPTVRIVTMECICLLIQQLIEFVITRNLTEGEILFDYAPPGYSDKYVDEYHCPVHFNCERIEFHVPLSLLDAPCPTADKEAYKLAVKLCGDMLDKLQGDESISTQVKRILLSSTPGSISQEAVAQQLCTTPRTLIRRLKQEGCAYREIQDSVLSELACRYLSEEPTSVEVIALMLGYSDTASFRKAFKRWTNLTPQQYRHSGSKVCT